MKRFYDITARVHELLRETLKVADRAIDATCGRGHDTEVLVERCGPQGRVYAIDLQQEAIEETRKRLAGRKGEVILIEGDHARLDELIMPEDRGRIAAVVFNLGFLPGSDKRIKTQSKTTLEALRKALSLLRPGGLLLVVIYTGHREGEDEQRAILRWLAERFDQRFFFWLEIPHGEKAPRLLVIERVAAPLRFYRSDEPSEKKSMTTLRPALFGAKTGP